jgi:pimeloyl-ACP methyl ester carboxylesterase
MAACQIERAALIGHSMGGAIALWTALEQPMRVGGLGLAGTGARLRVAPAILAGFDRDVPATIRLIVEFSYAPAAAPSTLAQAEASYAKCDPVVYQGDFVACAGFDVSARLAEIGCPTAVICGVEDRMTPPKHSEMLRDRVAGAALTLVPGAGHMSMIERPAAVSAALRALVMRC